MPSPRNSSNPFFEIEPGVSIELLQPASRGRLTLPVAVRSRLHEVEKSGPTVMLATVLGEGTIQFEAWSRNGDRLVAAAAEGAAQLDGRAKVDFLAAAADRWSRFLLQEDGRVILPPLLALHLNPEPGATLRIVSANGIATLYTAAAWREQTLRISSLLDGLDDA